MHQKSYEKLDEKVIDHIPMPPLLKTREDHLQISRHSRDLPSQNCHSSIQDDPANRSASGNQEEDGVDPSIEGLKVNCRQHPVIRAAIDLRAVTPDFG